MAAEAQTASKAARRTSMEMRIKIEMSDTALTIWGFASDRVFAYPTVCYDFHAHHCYIWLPVDIAALIDT